MEWKDFVAVGLVHFSKLRSSLDAEILALSSERYVFLLEFCQLSLQLFGSLLRLRQFLFDFLASFAERLLPVLDRGRPG